MTIPHRSPPTVDIQSDPTTTDEFGRTVGNAIDEKMDFLAYPRSRDGSPCNVGRTEQKLRIGSGLVLLTVAAVAPLSRGWRVSLAVLAAVELITGARRHCPVWQALGIDTSRAEAH